MDFTICAEINKYIHIHSSRNSLHSIRVNASILNTTIVASTISRLLNYTDVNLNLINKIMKDILLLAPLKSLKYPCSVIKLLEEFGIYLAFQILIE